MIEEIIKQIRGGDVRSIARAISWIENDLPDKEALIDGLFKHTGKARILGITGPPGSGKSSLLNHIIQLEREKGKKIAVLAIDPSSPFTGGAILGDRVRMQKHATDSSVFIRSMASRGHLGGVAGATADALKVLDAAGFDLIIIETIGVGQTEIEVMNIVDLVMLVLVPGLGDEIQALKAGVMEIGDIFVINKCDKDEASRVKAEVEYVLHLKNEGDEEKSNPIFMTSATQNIGLQELVDGIDEEFRRMEENGRLSQRRLKRLELELKHILTSKIQAHVNKFLNTDNNLSDWLRQLANRQATPYQLVNRKVSQVLKELKE
ncbi:LAO/AO transport system ATPase [Caldithrix abyssi DSM 13497]|uniref:LAO/AO transport system ATPase n=1 Tax=Caldithrix abyssi DSM 13497 TaxID=880073 RepID=H1XU43_CALAY|nr:methylmalonyl Co-A mutase-associated GTPase MeaB [Caldithrix abyssi]APF16860.1 LAO/AO transport system kinase [Caldithrix abyssi DSM 13497]EHO40486.1 LAO/AO transport system ATPase [Caldithrix abyssi DSM 13497]